jgi:hypothetical protein
MELNLILGGWYLIDEPDVHHGEKAKITSINYESNYVTMFNCREFEVCKDDLRPIPITDEILEANGWKVEETDPDDGARLFYLDKNDEDTMWFWEPTEKVDGLFAYTVKKGLRKAIEELPVNYLHELQIAIQACGGDKEVHVYNFLPPFRPKQAYAAPIKPSEAKKKKKNK